MSHHLALSVPDQASPGTSTYRVGRITLDFLGPHVAIQLVGEHGIERVEEYAPADGAEALIAELTAADLSQQDLQGRVLARLVADGRLSGTVGSA